MGVLSANLNGGCCCYSPSDCHGIPQTPACLWAGPLRSAGQLDYLYAIDFRSKDVQLPLVGKYWISAVSREYAIEHEYGGEFYVIDNNGNYLRGPNGDIIFDKGTAPIYLLFEAGRCCDPEERASTTQYVSILNGRIREDSIPDFSGKYVRVTLHVFECPDPEAPLPQPRGLHTFKAPSECGKAVCQKLDSDYIPLSTIEELKELLPTRRGEVNECGHLLLHFEPDEIAGVCDPALWHLAYVDGTKLVERKDFFLSYRQTLCFGSGKRLEDLPDFDSEETFEDFVKPVFAGSYRRCEEPQEPMEWLARNGTYPFYTGYTLNNPSITEATVEEYFQEKYMWGIWTNVHVGYYVKKPQVTFDMVFVPQLEIPYLMSAFGDENQEFYTARWKFEGFPSLGPVWDGVGKGNDTVIIEGVYGYDDPLQTEKVYQTPTGPMYENHGPELSGKVEMADGIATLILTESDLAIINRKRTVTCDLWFRGTFIDNPEVQAYYWKAGEDEYGDPIYDNGWYEVGSYNYKTGGSMTMADCLARAVEVRDLLNAGIQGAIASIMGRSAAENGATSWEDPEDWPSVPYLNEPFYSCDDRGGSPKVELSAFGFWNE